MNWLDRAVGWVSPQAGLQRARARARLHAVRAYEGAKTGRRNENWITSGTDANSEIRAASARLRHRARDLVRNNVYGAKAVSSLAANVIGRGIVPRARVGETEVGNETVASQIDALWERWTRKADADGLTDLYGLQTLVTRTLAESGEALVLRERRPPDDGLPVPLQIRVLEADHLDGTKDALLEDGGWIQQGIEFDGLGRRRAYWIHPVHPGSNGSVRSGRESIRVTADSVLHVYEPLRPNQIRGVTWFAPTIVALADLGNYEEAERYRKAIEACFVAFVTGAEDTVALGDRRTEQNGRRIETFSPGMVEYLAPGEDIKFGEPKGAGGYAEYMRIQLHGIAAGVGLTYELLTGDLSQVNFSSARMGLLEFRRRVKQIQEQQLIPQFCEPIWGWFIEIGQMARVLPQGNIDVRWSLPRFEAVEPLKDATAELVRLRSGTLTLPEAISGHGYDPGDQLAELAATNAKLDELGIVLDSDPRKTTKSGVAQADDEDDEDAALIRLAREFGAKPNGHVHGN